MSRRTFERNAFETGLAAAINDSVTSIILNSTVGLTAPGYMTLDPTDPGVVEFIRFDTINVNTLENCTRGLAGSAGGGGSAHALGARARMTFKQQHLDDIFLDIEDLEQADTDHAAAANPHAIYLTEAEADALYLQLTGGTLVGPLTLDADPTAALEAATRQYVDGLVGGLALSFIERQIFTADGTWTKPALAKTVVVTCVGAGGGGGGAQLTGGGLLSAGSSAGGGGFAQSVIPEASLGATEPITIGVGGAGGIGNNFGSAGTVTQFGSGPAIVEGSAGGGGVKQPAAGQIGISGGIGATAAACIGDIKLEGDDGGPLFSLDLNRIVVHQGGASRMSGSIPGGHFTVGAIPAELARPFGGGGGGPVNFPNEAVATGAAGADGVVIVDTFG